MEKGFAKELPVGKLTGRRYRLGVHDIEGGPIFYVGRFYSSSTEDDGIMRDIIREYNIAVASDPNCTMVMSKFDCDSGVQPGHQEHN